MSLIQNLRIRVARAIAGKSNDMRPSTLVRAAAQLGIWQDVLGGFVPREVNPYFYEALREAIAPIDGGIGRLVTMDGIIRVRGGNDRLTQAIANGLMADIAVNDNEAGLQAFYASQSNELYEQGFTVGEMLLDESGRELVGLRVADSKGVYYRRDADSLALQTWYRPPTPRTGGRRDGTDRTEAVLRNRVSNSGNAMSALGYVQLDESSLVYAAFNPESAGPYGVSVMRSLEFVSQILLRIQNATGHVWDRYGDPPLQLTYKVGNTRLLGSDLDKRRDALAKELAAVVDAKRNGNSADFVQALGKDDDITIKAIGAEGQVIELEMPARHMMEQILAKFGLPAWMLGMQWSTAERMAEQQSEIVLQESRTRFVRRLPGLNRVVATWLRGRGFTWKPGDWELYQELPRLQDMLKDAQAEFLRAQTAMMLGGTTPSVPESPGSPPGTGLEPKKTATLTRMKVGDIEFDVHAHSHCGKAPNAGGAEPWAEPDAELPRIEARAADGLLALWGDLRDRVLRILQLPLVKSAKAPGDVVWTFDVLGVLREIAEAEDWFIKAAGAEDGPLLREVFRAFVRGLENAAAPLGAEAAIEQTREQMRNTLVARGLELVRNATARTLRNDILAELTDGSYDGMNPREVAQRLSARFAARDYDWQRLARSEVARAQSMGKLAQYEELGVTECDFVTASEGVCPQCIGLAEAGPYPIRNCPIPVDDTHPNCFPAGTVVNTPGVLGSTARWYEGELVEIVTARGHELSVTPNHPILTPDGWVAAGDLNKGSHVVCCANSERVIALVAPDDDHTPARIEDVAETLRGTLPVAPIRMPVTPEDFHGDGMNSNVDVVEAHCLLRNRIGNTEHVHEQAFAFADVEPTELPGDGSSSLAFVRDDLPASGAVGGFSEAQSFVSGGALHSHLHAVGLIPDDCSAGSEEPNQRWSADSDALGERLNALTGVVSTDEIVRIFRRPFAHYVYNLETPIGWYIAQGIIVHNCRCTILARDPAA